MTEPLDAIAIAAEVIAWLTLPIGLVLLSIGVGRRAWANRYRSAKAVITAVNEHDAKLRWFAEEGDLHETVLPLTAPMPAVGDARTVWIHPSRPGSARLDTPAHDGRALLLLGGILGGVGVLGILVSALMPFFQ